MRWLLFVLLVGCGHSTGGMGERCGPDKSCNTGLFCDVDTCVTPFGLADANDRDAFEPPGDGPRDAPPTADAPIHLDAKLVDAPIITMMDANTNCVNRVQPAPQAHIHSAGATTHAGEACIVSGCHAVSGATSTATPFQFAGTLYTTAGPFPQVGATVRVTDAVNKVVQMTTDTAGNFYLQAGTFPTTFPAITGATACPTFIEMTATLQNANDGNCNRGGCHSGNVGSGPITL